MNQSQKINLISILLIIIAVAMIGIGIKAQIAAPPLTGAGFLIIAAGFQFLKTKS